MARFHCPHCCHPFSAQGHLASHLRQARYCRIRAAENVQSERAPTPDPFDLDDFETLEPDPILDDENMDNEAIADAVLDDFYALRSAPDRQVASPPPPEPLPRVQRAVPPLKAPSPDVTDFYDGAAKILRKEKTINDRWAEKHGHADNPYFPFASKLDWEVGRWAKQEGPGVAALDRLLKCEGVRDDLLVH